MLLDRLTGAECPNCGCRDSIELDVRTRRATRCLAGSRQELVARLIKRRCSHCRRVWTEGGQWEPLESSEPQAIEPSRDPPPGTTRRGLAIVCPLCGSTNTSVRSTRARYRYCRCGDCAARFKAQRGD